MYIPSRWSRMLPMFVKSLRKELVIIAIRHGTISIDSGYLVSATPLNRSYFTFTCVLS